MKQERTMIVSVSEKGDLCLCTDKGTYEDKTKEEVALLIGAHIGATLEYVADKKKRAVLTISFNLNMEE